MRFNKDISGLERLRTNGIHQTKTRRGGYPSPIKKQASEDTRIRREIYRIIMEMINDGKSNIETEIYLRNLYPDYAEFIPQVVNDQYNKKINSKKKLEHKEIIDNGDER